MLTKQQWDRFNQCQQEMEELPPEPKRPLAFVSIARVSAPLRSFFNEIHEMLVHERAREWSRLALASGLGKREQLD